MSIYKISVTNLPDLSIDEWNTFVIANSVQSMQQALDGALAQAKIDRGWSAVAYKFVEYFPEGAV